MSKFLGIIPYPLVFKLQNVLLQQHSSPWFRQLNFSIFIIYIISYFLWIVKEFFWNIFDFLVIHFSHVFLFFVLWCLYFVQGKILVLKRKQVLLLRLKRNNGIAKPFFINLDKKTGHFVLPFYIAFIALSFKIWAFNHLATCVGKP